MPFSRFTLVLVVAACALLSAAAPTTASSGGLKVLVSGNCDYPELVTALQAQAGIASVTTFDARAATPTAAQFAARDIVIDTGDTCGAHGYLDAATYGNRLANYVDKGGVILQIAYANWNSAGSYPTGRFASGGYPPLSLGPNDNISTTLGQVLKPHSPIVKGLGTFATSNNTTTPLAPGATLLAKWADGRNAIARKGRVVATSASPDSSDVAELARLARNTGQYFNAVPTTKITKSTINGSARTAAFRFKAVGPFSSGFRCALKKAGMKPIFKPCRAHKTYVNLQLEVAYTFEVVAVGPGGPDPTPAKKRFEFTT